MHICNITFEWQLAAVILLLVFHDFLMQVCETSYSTNNEMGNDSISITYFLLYAYQMYFKSSCPITPHHATSH